jgi:hypothetical protein
MTKGFADLCLDDYKTTALPTELDRLSSAERVGFKPNKSNNDESDFNEF